MTRGTLAILALLSGACSGGGDKPTDAGIDSAIDAPENIPTLTSFSPDPATVSAGVATAITWTWTYLTTPVFPDPVCTIDHGVGTVTNGQMTMVTLDATTSFRLSCSNRAGMTARDTVISIPLAAPNITTFTATPSPLSPNAATTVTFNWTYTTTPSPVPTCTIDGGIGTATPGMTAGVTLSQARTYRLSCQNSQGSSTRDVTVTVTECGATAQCNANATCSDTPESYTCACNNGYTGNGDICSAQLNCGMTSSFCDTHATCSGGTTCICNAGYVGDGSAGNCTREHLTFVTTSTGTGNLSSWALAGGNTGLTAADAICNSEAGTAGLTGTFVAWMSDGTSDAFCRVNGLTGTKTTNCGGLLGATPAGPWVRTDSARTPAAPTIDKLLAPTRQTFNPVTFSAGGTDQAFSAPQLIFTGTNDSGVLTGTACTNWTVTSGTAAMGDMFGGGTAWTDQGTDPGCGATGRLRCVEVGAGPALPPRHPGGKRAFVTSVSGTGVLGTWADAQGLTGISAADAICQARARYAGYTNASYFKAWASYSFTSAYNRVFNNVGPYYRPDGIQFATRTQMTSASSSSRVNAPLYQTETGSYVAGDADTSSVWTGTTPGGSYNSSGTCSSWSSTGFSAVVGRTDLADFRWVALGTNYFTQTLQACSATDYRLYCVEDSP